MFSRPIILHFTIAKTNPALYCHEGNKCFKRHGRLLRKENENLMNGARRCHLLLNRRWHLSPSFFCLKNPALYCHEGNKCLKSGMEVG
jgi:hypothetical protein